MPRPKPKLRGIPHLVGAIIALPAVIMLSRSAQPGAFTDAAMIYGASLLCLLGSSAFYHTPYWSKPIRGKLRSVDHAMIYVLIAGSYIPFLATLGEHAPSYVGPLAISGCGLGVLQTIFWANAPRLIRTIAYSVIGCFAIMLMPAIYTQLGATIMWLLVGSGVCYLVGAAIYARRYPNPNPLIFGYHEVFHCLVNIAAALHFVGIWKILT